jgi:predicted Fe-Mo cluster-binding NifX family protein
VSYIENVLPPKPAREPGVSIFAVPVADGQVAPKFSQAPQFALITVKNGAIQGKQMLDTPPEIAELPAWLESLSVSHVLAGDLGEGPREVLKKKGIEVVTDVSNGDPEALVLRFAG